MDIKTHLNDLPNDLNLGNEIAVDTEAMGLEPKRDPLTLVQISTGNNDCHIILLMLRGYISLHCFPYTHTKGNFLMVFMPC